MESLTNEETKLVSQFRMTYKEASEVLANTTDRCPSDCKPWRKDARTAHVGRGEKSVVVSHDEDASGTGSEVEDGNSLRDSFSSGEGKLTMHLKRSDQGLHDDTKADATETTMEPTDFSESTEHGAVVMLSETQPKAETSEADSILAEAEVVADEKTAKTATTWSKPTLSTQQKIASKVQENVPVTLPVAPAGAFQSAVPSLSNTLMREYDLTYSKARSVIMEARTKLGNKVDQKALERHCRSLVLFKGKEDFRNVVLRSIDRGNDDSSNEIASPQKQTISQDPQFVGSCGVETMIMNQYKILYSSAKHLTDEARAELGMKPWDNMTEEFKQTCDRLYSEKFAVASRPSWSTGAIADAKSFFESYGNRPFDQEDQVFRRRTQTSKSDDKKLGRSVASEVNGKNRSSFLDNRLTSLGCLDVIEESIEISHGTCIDDENTKAETIHVDYENEDNNDCSTSSDSIVHLGDIVESAVTCVQETTCHPTATPKVQEKSPFSQAEQTSDKKQPDEEPGISSCVKACSTQEPSGKDEQKSKDDAIVKTVQKCKEGDFSIPSAAPGCTMAKPVTKAVLPGKRITKTRKKKTSQATRSASSSSARKTSGQVRKPDPLTEKIASDRKTSTPVSIVDSSVNSEEHSQKTVRIKNTKKSHSKAKQATTKQTATNQILPVTEEASDRSQSAHDEANVIEETATQKSTSQHRPASNRPKKKREPTKKQAPIVPSTNENEILEAILMSQFGMDSALASKVASKAQKNTNFPEWKKWNALLLAECERQLEALNEKIDKRTSDLQIGDTGEPKKHQQCGRGVKAETGGPENQSKSRDTDSAPTDSSKPDASGITDKDIMEAEAEDLLERKSKFDPVCAMYPPRMMYQQQYPQLTGAEAMARPLETILTRRHGISWSTASHMVKRGRRALDMTESEAWTPQLEEHCEQEIMDGASSVGETAMSYSLADTRSIVVSVAAASQRMDCDTEVGKDWTEHTLEECSQVSRCPSQTNDFVIVEDGSCASECSLIEETPPAGYNMGENSNDPLLKAEVVPNPLGVPQVIYLFHGQFPEVPGDEPLEARVGMPFIRSGTRRSKKKSFLDRMRRSLRRFRRKAIGYRPRRLQEDDTECRVQTLMSL